MNIFKLIGEIFKPAAELIDNVHTSDEERLIQKATLLNTQADALSKAFDYETKQFEVRAGIITAEAKSDSWLTKSWRPITMLWLLALVSAWWLGWVDHPRLTEEIVLSAFGLVKIGVGGYIASRGVEKIAPSVVEALKKKDQV